MKSSICSLLFALLLPAVANANANAVPWQQLELLGEGRFSRLWFDIYDARLYSAQPRWPGETSAALPLALSITYLRDIKAEALVEATAEQWQLQPRWANHPQQGLWLAQLRQLWPNINKGDNLTLWLDSGGHAHFYYNQQPLGQVSDPGFGYAFADIWLSAATSAPELRAQLLGEKP